MSAAKKKAADERRHNLELRELLDELVNHVRRISHEAPNMPPEDLEYARERLEWLADEIWDQVTRGTAK